MELQDYWRTVRRRWVLVLGSVVVLVALAAAYTWSVTPLYSSSTRLFVSTSQSDENSAYTGNLFATQRVASEKGPKDQAVIELTGVYHNLLRRWTEV